MNRIWIPILVLINCVYNCFVILRKWRITVPQFCWRTRCWKFCQIWRCRSTLSQSKHARRIPFYLPSGKSTLQGWGFGRTSTDITMPKHGKYDLAFWIRVHPWLEKWLIQSWMNFSPKGQVILPCFGVVILW